jgi:hypothetical protein
MMTLSLRTPIALISAVQAMAAAPCAVHHHLDLIHLAARQFDCVDQPAVAEMIAVPC